MNTNSFQSFLIVGGSLSERKKHTKQLVENLKIAQVDQIIEGDCDSIKIEIVREIIQFLSFPPYTSSSKVVILFEIQQASSETQHAILKTLEEPPPFAVLILTAPRKESVLPTILSRLYVITIAKNDEYHDSADFIYEVITILNEKDAKRFEYGSKIGSDSEQTLIWLQKSLSAGRKYLLAYQKKASSDEKLTYSIYLKQLSRALKTISQTNTNTRLLMENLMLELPILPRLDRKTD